MRAGAPLLTPEQVWRVYDETEARLAAPVSERMLDLAVLRAGMRVLDLGTGRGEPAIRAAHRVGPTGRVVGVDIAEDMLRMARERADREGVTNLELRHASAESLDGIPDQYLDATLARWVLMYLDAPVAALSAARRAMRPSGRLVAAVWAEPERAPYFSWPRRVLEKYTPLPPIDMEVAGAFRYADQRRLQRDFAAAGLTVEQVEEMDIPVMEARTGDELLAWVKAFGLARLLQGLPNEVQRAWEADLLREAEPLRREGCVRLGGVTRIVVAAPAV